LLSGKLADLGRTRLTIGLGAALFGFGLILAGFGGSVAWMAATLGMMTSVGSGCAYGTVIGSMVRWFPDRRGLASGIAVAAVGLGPIILAPLASALMAAYGVMAMFKILGVICLLAMGAAAVCVTNPPAGYAPAGWTPPAAAPGRPAGGGDVDWRRMLGRPRFWLLYACYFCGVFAGVLVNSFAAPSAGDLIRKQGLATAGAEAAAAAFAVMLFAFASAGGRILWGFLSDLLGRIFMIGLAFALTALAMFTLYGGLETPGVFLPCLFMAGLCYGGIFGTFPSLSAESFGLKNAAVNLAILFTSFSLVAFLAPQVVAYYRAAGPDDRPKAFLVAGCVAAAGIVLSMLVGGARKGGTDVERRK
jgi:OFA family oxalate/formate antiporter-like MFS transporter